MGMFFTIIAFKLISLLGMGMFLLSLLLNKFSCWVWECFLLSLLSKKFPCWDENVFETGKCKLELENPIELSKYIWLCKDKGKNFEIRWKIIRNAPSYKIGSKFC